MWLLLYLRDEQNATSFENEQTKQHCHRAPPLPNESENMKRNRIQTRHESRTASATVSEERKNKQNKQTIGFFFKPN